MMPAILLSCKGDGNSPTLMDGVLWHLYLGKEQKELDSLR